MERTMKEIAYLMKEHGRKMKKVEKKQLTDEKMLEEKSRKIEKKTLQGI
jgi:hypothetical protein